MRQQHLLLGLCISIGLLFTQQLPAKSLSTTYHVGFKKVRATSAATKDKLPISLLYPSTTAEAPQQFGPFKLDLAIGGQFAAGQFPLVVLSHGSGASPLSYRTLAMAMVKQGFIVAIPLHPKNNFQDNQYEQSVRGHITNWQVRPKDISTTIDTLLADERIAKHVQTHNIAIVGHSAGGYTALAAAGGHAYSQPMIDLCQDKGFLSPDFCQAVMDENITAQTIYTGKDPRITAIVLMAPTGIVFDQDGALDDVNIPALLLVAEKDDILIEPHHSQVITKRYPNPDLITVAIIENAGHFSFLSPFPDTLAAEIGEVGKDPKGFNRQQFSQELPETIIDFLQQHTKE